MSRVIELADLPADPIALARSLSDRPGVCAIWGAAEGDVCYIGCEPVETSVELCPQSTPFGEDESEFAGVPRWVGVLPYEAARQAERTAFSPRPDPRTAPHLSRPCWVRYGAMARVSREVTIVGDDARAGRELARLLRRRVSGRAGCSLALAEPPEPEQRHIDRIRAALELIGQGELYQVNLARRYRLQVRGSGVDLLQAMRQRAPSPYCLALDLPDATVVSTSPELFLRLDADGVVTTSPIKGTRPRGATVAEDRSFMAALDADPKERAELAMVIDVERNDLGRIAVTGSVELIGRPRVITRGTVHHREATLRARLRPELGQADLVRAMLPSGSVTGAPKVRAMEVIAALEAERRGLYTGALGTVLGDGSLRLSMAIRTLTVCDGEGHYFAGGGIVADSDPVREVEETRWKALQLGVAL
ncbi:MAG: anthranilate synthase component I family protein [Polyangiaceae bacterium]|nr:anthranilate synthase component I family protein [Polyangiaceae bacterium]